MIEFEQVFGNRKRRKYGLISNLIYNMRCSFQCDKRLFFYQLLPILPAVAAAYLGTLIPAELVRSLQERWNISQIVGYICLLTLIMMLCNLVVTGMNVYEYHNSHLLTFLYNRKCIHKIMGLDYDLLESPEERKLAGNVWHTIRGGYTITVAQTALPECGTAMLGVLFYGILIAQKSIVLVLALLASVSLSMKLLSVARKKHGEYHSSLSRYSREVAYISRQAVESSAGKDIRIYRMADWFLRKYDEALEHMDKIYISIHNWYFLRSFSDALIGFVVDFFAWGYLIYLLATGRLSTAEFVLYLGLVSGFSAYLETLIRKVMELAPMSVSISYIREFLELQNNWGREGKGIPLEPDTPMTVELRDVSYTYPGRETPTLSHINLTLRPGEKIALLGLNGAGKTTLVKLICGFYHPTEGQVLVNGKPLTDYAREDYYKNVSVLFQDTTLLPVTLDENLTGQQKEHIDRERLKWALSMSGALEKYNSLPKKGETPLVREVNADSLDFSGGERQKLLFARALYKKARLLILDEPTAALDPIAENELYQSFSQAAEGRSSVYISHRLSSTRFCDRIVLLEHGQIVEEGTHESLMQGRTRYAELFELQSKYYKEQEELARRSRIMGDEYVEEQSRKEGIFHE